MKRLQPVIWTKGTFLTPQHLQLQDRFLEDTLQFRLEVQEELLDQLASLALSKDDIAMLSE